MKSVEKRSRAGWPRIAPATFAVAAFVSSSLAAALLSGMSLAQLEEEAPSLEYTSEGTPYEERLRGETTLEETTPEETAAPENTATGHSVSAPVEQYYVPPSEGVLADTGGAGLWLAGGVGLAILAVLALMLFSLGLTCGRAGISSGGSENRRGGSRYE